MSYTVSFLEPDGSPVGDCVDDAFPASERWHIRGQPWDLLSEATHIALNASRRRPRCLYRVMSDLSHTPFAVYKAGREVRCSDVG